jgi:hypothetical protein
MITVQIRLLGGRREDNINTEMPQAPRVGEYLMLSDGDDVRIVTSVYWMLDPVVCALTTERVVRLPNLRSVR